MSKVSITKSKLDNLANAVAAKSGIPVLLSVDEMTDAVLGINIGEMNVLEGVQLGGKDLVINNKKVNIPVLSDNSPSGAVGVVNINWLSDQLGYAYDAIHDLKINFNGTIYDDAWDTTIGHYTYTIDESDPTVPDWAKASTKPTYTATEVGALPSNTIIPQIFKVRYSSSTNTADKTYAEIEQAYNQGNLVLLEDGGNYTYQMTRQSLGYLFTVIEDLTRVGSTGESNSRIQQLRVSSSNTWSTYNYKLPKNTSDLINDSGFLTSYTETDPVYSASAAANITSTDISNWNSKTSNTGTVTSVGLSNATNGGLTISGSPITSSGSITVGHTNVLSAAQTTQAVYPIKIDKNGHISAYGTAVTSMPASDVSAWAKASSKPSYSFSEIGSKPTTISGYGITDAYTKTEVDNKVSAVLRYKGVKATVGDLPSTGNITGDTWHVTATSGEYAWDGSEWQELGTAISIPASTGSSTTGITIANHSTGSVIGVSSSTTSVYGVSSSTTTASKVTLGTAKSVPNVTNAGSASNWVFEDITVPIRADNATSIPNVTSAGTAASWTFGDITVPIRADADTTVPVAASSATTVPTAASSATTVPIKNGTATTVPTAASSATACDDITSWAAGSGSASLTFTMDTTDTKKLKIAFSHTHTAPTLEYTARSITGVSGSTSIYGVQSTTTSVTGVSGSTTVTGVSGSTTVRGVKTGTSSTTTASHVTGGGNGTAPTLGTAISIYGVKSGTGSTTTASHVKSGGNGTAPTLGTAISIPNVTEVTDVTVPIKNADATTVPIKNSSATTVVTSATHSVTDNGHTHTI